MKKSILLVAKTDASGSVSHLGALTFDKSNHGSLETEGASKAVDQLRQDWLEISKLKELIWKKSVMQTVDGKKVVAMVGETYKPGDDNYIYAVLNTLERKYGYQIAFGD